MTRINSSMTNYISTQYSYVVVIVSHGTFFYRALAGPSYGNKYSSFSVGFFFSYFSIILSVGLVGFINQAMD